MMNYKHIAVNVVAIFTNMYNTHSCLIKLIHNFLNKKLHDPAQRSLMRVVTLYSEFVNLETSIDPGRK